MRPIVSAIGSPSYGLAKELSRILDLLAGHTEHKVKNSTAFTERIRGFQLAPEDQLVSFDVTSLFIQVPINEALRVVKEQLNKDQTLSERTSIPVSQLVELVELCLRTTYFQFQDNYFEQTDGAAMGSPLSPVIANLFIEDLEQKAIQSAVLQPKLWVRYVDDTFIIWPHGKEHLHAFHEHLNQQNPNNQFTIDEEKEGQIAFLDVLVTRQAGRMSTSVYRKPTNTDCYIPFSSHHHPRVLTGVIRFMRDRALQVCDEDHRQQELHHLEKVFTANGFPTKVVKSSLSMPQKPPSNTSQDTPSEEPKVLCLPYVRRLSEKIEKVCAPLGIKAVFKPSNTLRQSPVHVKNRLPEEKKRSVVYQVPCKGCDQVYIGETKRNLKIRLAEHRQAVRRGDDKNGIVVHVQKCNHSIDWEGARVEQVMTNYWKRRTTEAILIRQQSPTKNLDRGLHLPSVWNPILDSSQHTFPP